MGMTKTDLARHALELPIEEQIELAQTLWEHASPEADLALSDELRNLLEARLLEAHSNSREAREQAVKKLLELSRKATSGSRGRRWTREGLHER